MPECDGKGTHTAKFAIPGSGQQTPAMITASGCNTVNPQYVNLFHGWNDNGGPQRTILAIQVHTEHNGIIIQEKMIYFYSLQSYC